MIKLSLVQAGDGIRRPLVMAFHVMTSTLRSSLAAAGLGHAMALIGMADQGGYGAPPAWTDIMARARAEGWPGGPVVLIGYSAGCAAVRELLRAEARPDVVIALDGTHGPRGVVPAAEPSIAPWRLLCERARENEVLAILTHTYQTYTEALPHGERFPASVSVVRAATGWPLAQGGPVGAPVETRDGSLVVLSYASAPIDKAAHVAQQTAALPHALGGYVVQWLEGRMPTERAEGE